MKRILAILLMLALALSLAACGKTETKTETPEETAAPAPAPTPAATKAPAPTAAPEKTLAGTYIGKAAGYHGDVQVEVELDADGKMVNVKVGDNNETEGVGTTAIDKIPGKIVDTQSLAVDAVSGATVTSRAIEAAIADALVSAGLDPAAYGYTPAERPTVELSAFDAAALPEKKPVTGSVTVTDVKGREVTIDLPVSRYAVSTMDVIDFIIPLLGKEAFDKLAASGQDGGGGLQGYGRLYVPIVGDYMVHCAQISEHNAPFDLEMILAADPDVLIVNSAMGAHKYAMEIEEQLTKAGIPIVLIDVPGSDLTTSSQNTIRLLGQIFEKEERSNEVCTFLDAQFALIKDKNLAQRTDKPTVYYEKSGHAEIFGNTSVSTSGWGAVIALAGGENIADKKLLNAGGQGGGQGGKGGQGGGQSGGKGGPGGATLDPEYIIQSDPDFIVLSGSGIGWMDIYPGSTPQIPNFDIVNRVGWPQLRAVKNLKVYELAHAMSRSVFCFYACQKLAQTFYPEEFTGIDVDANIREFFDRFMLTDSTVTGWFYQMTADAVTK